MFRQSKNIFLITCSLVISGFSTADSLLLDSFEYDVIPDVRPGNLLWSQYESDPTDGPDPGSETITSEEAFVGEKSLKITLEGGNAYTQFYPKVEDRVWSNARNFVKEGEWEFDKYNRMRFWVKLPPGITYQGEGQTNAHFGTYVRSKNGDESSAESGGNHFYHYFDLESTGEWHQIIIDTHPSHSRGESGGLEEGDKEYATGEVGYNYFDGLTRFYFDLDGGLPNYPSAIYFDGFEFYEEKNPENINQIYGLNGVYVPASNKLIVGWKRDKDENKVKHEVRYSFSDVFSIGWDNAEVAPNGTITPPGWQGYNGMYWNTTDINLSGKKSIFIAIKPENSNLFRQIEIPLSLSGKSPPVFPNSFSGKKIVNN